MEEKQTQTPITPEEAKFNTYFKITFAALFAVSAIENCARIRFGIAPTPTAFSQTMAYMDSALSLALYLKYFSISLRQAKYPSPERTAKTRNERTRLLKAFINPRYTH